MALSPHHGSRETSRVGRAMRFAWWLLLLHKIPRLLVRVIKRHEVPCKRQCFELLLALRARLYGVLPCLVQTDINIPVRE